MISSSKLEKMLIALKDYKKRYLTKDIGDLDESGTRIMINTFLTSILGYQELEEIKNLENEPLKDKSLITRLKLSIYQHLQKHGFITVLIMASVLYIDFNN